MKGIRLLFLLFVSLLLSIPAQVAANNFENKYNAMYFTVMPQESGCVHIKVLVVDAVSGDNNYWRNGTCYMMIGGQKVQVFRLKNDNAQSDGDDYADIIVEAPADDVGVLVLTNPKNVPNDSLNGVKVDGALIKSTQTQYTMEKTKGKNPNTAEFDFFYNPRFAGERVDFYVDIDVGNDDDVHDRKMSGSPVSFSSLPNTTINDPVFMPSGEDMGFYSLIVSNTTGSPLKLDAVTEIVQNGESNIDLTELCKSDDNGFSILIPAANYTRDVLIEASIPFSPYVYYKMESKTFTLNAFHNPTTFNLSSQWGNKGATVLKWTVPYPNDDDAVAADRFAVERQLYDSNLPLATALQDFSSKVRNGDIIKSQDEFAVYDSETGWQGNLHYMKPAQGYMLKHNADKEGDVVTFVYPYRTTADIVEMAGAPAYHNVRPTTMNMIVQADGIEAREGELLGTAPSSIDYQANTLQGTTALPKVIDFTDISMMEDGMWYALNGIFLGERRPTAKGIYILNRKKVVIK